MKLLLLDKDGTLISPRSGAKFVTDPWDQQPLPNVSNFLATLGKNGWKMAICSNQAGIAAGHKILENVILEMKFALQLFPQIDDAYFCPDFEGQKCYRCWADCVEQCRILYDQNSCETRDLKIENQFRKPRPGMLKLAASFCDFDEILYVGDRPENKSAAIAAGIPFQWAANFFS